jgi:hypothetical protein
MTKNTVVNFAGRDAMIDPLTALLRTGAKRTREELMALYDFPAIIGSACARATQANRPSATTRHRTKRPRGCLTRDAMLHGMFKLV